MRLTLTSDEFDKLCETLKEHREFQAIDILLSAKEKYQESLTDKKRLATKQANKSKIDATKKKIENAINLLRIQSMKINMNTVAKESGLSYNTVRKYQYIIEKNSSN